MSNLRLINETEISGSQSTTNITNLFNLDFDIYKITITDISTVSSTPTAINVRFIDSAGNVLVDGSYDYALLTMYSYQAFTEKKNTNQSKIEWIGGYAGQSPHTLGTTLYIFNPYNSSYTFVLGQNASSNVGGSGETNWKSIGVYKQTTAITGIQLIDGNGSRPYNSGLIRTYGLRVDS